MPVEQMPSQVERLRTFTKHLKAKAALALEVYENGGKHIKDLEIARTYAYVINTLETLFPELEQVGK